VAVLGGEVEAVDLAQPADALQRGGAERRLALECVEDDAFDDVAEGHVQGRGEALQHLEDALLDADAGLDAMDLTSVGHRLGGSGRTNSRRASGEAVVAATS